MPVDKNKVPWPSRQEWIDWGLVACRESDCRTLVNPTLLPRKCCTLCARRRRKGRRR